MTANKKVSNLLIIAGICILLASWRLLDASEDPISRFGMVKFNKGTMAPGFMIEDLAGKLVKLEDYRGKLVLLNFWTTW